MAAMGEGSRKNPFDAALGDAILGYLDALPPEDLVRAFLAMSGPNGVREEAFLQAWAGSAAEREELLSAAKKLQDAGELRRVRVPAGGEGGEPSRILWFLGLWATVLPATVLLLLVRKLGDRIAPGYGTVTAITLGVATLVLPFATMLLRTCSRRRSALGPLPSCGTSGMHTHAFECSDLQVC